MSARCCAHSGRLGRSYPQHDGDGAQVAHLLLPVAIVDAVFQACAQLAAVGSVPLSGLGGEDVAVLERNLVGGRQHRAVEENVLDAHGEPVSPANLVGLRIWVAVEEDLGANVPDALLELPAGGEDGIERVDVGVDGFGKGWVGRLVLGRTAEQVLSSLGVEARGPRLLGCGRRHGCVERRFCK